MTDDSLRPANSALPDPSVPSPGGARVAAVIVAVSVATIVGLSLWFLSQPQALIVQGEADATRIDVAAGRVLVAIDNPQLVAKLAEAEAAKAVAVADLTRFEVGAQGGGRLGGCQCEAGSANI